MKIVLDTNVFISGVFWGGAPSRILQMWKDGKVSIILTKEIFMEYHRVLQGIAKTDILTERWSEFILENCVMVSPKTHSKICRDVDDNKFLDAAIVGDAQFLVTGDNDLLVLKKIKRTKIVKPTQFLSR